VKQIVDLEVRHDPAGSGYFGAPRGGRKHDGIDYACTPGGLVLSPVAGAVTKLGICYSDDHSYRYVEVTDAQGLRHRVMYVYPLAEDGARVEIHDPIGRAQDVSLRYPGKGMLPHVHYEVLDDKGGAVNPSAIEIARL